MAGEEITYDANFGMYVVCVPAGLLLGYIKGAIRTKEEKSYKPKGLLHDIGLSTVVVGLGDLLMSIGPETLPEQLVDDFRDPSPPENFQFFHV